METTLVIQKNVNLKSRLNPDSIPTLGIVSTDIRRDLIAPLRYFSRLHIVHFYHKATYGDLYSTELGDNLVPYRNAVELFLRLWKARTSFIQGVEPSNEE